mgnify:CR=1 FL=1
MSNLFVKIFRDKVEEIMPVTFELGGLSSADVGKRLQIDTHSSGGLKIVPAVDVDFDGAYSSLSGTPNFHAVATSGDYADLINQPALFDGDWSSLANVPSFFDGQWSSIQGKPGLVELSSSSTPTEGDVAVYEAGISGNPGQWVLKKSYEMESIDTIQLNSSGTSLNLSTNFATTILLDPQTTATSFSVSIQPNNVQEGRIIRFHFYDGSNSPALDNMSFSCGTINGDSQPIDLKRNGTIQLQCISQSGGKFIIV